MNYENRSKPGTQDTPMGAVLPVTGQLLDSLILFGCICLDPEYGTHKYGVKNSKLKIVLVCPSAIQIRFLKSLGVGFLINECISKLNKQNSHNAVSKSSR